MILSNDGIKNKEEWEKAGYKLSSYDVDAVRAKTLKNPEWVHFGAGNIFRAFQAVLCEELLSEGKMSTGIIAAEGYDPEIIKKMYLPHDNLSLVVTLKSDGSVDKAVNASIAEALVADPLYTEDFERLKNIFKSPSLKMASFTITEKGYVLADGNGQFFPGVLKDMEEGPKTPSSYIGKVTSLLYERFLTGYLPLAMVSMDNCSHNGDRLSAAVLSYAKAWEKNGKVQKGFAAYVSDRSVVSFPWTMIDKITPRPDEKIKKLLGEDGVEDLESIVTSKNTYVAPFVNAEECRYLVIEDAFPNGKIPFKNKGVYYTNKETVDKVEKMKVCTCLNPLHTALAVFGCLLSHNLISEEMKDEHLKKLVETIGYTEGLPVVVNPGIINPKDFIDEVVNVRIPNPFMPDTPQRIAMDTSQKLSVRYGETIKAYLANDSLNVGDLRAIPFVFAGWLRYVLGINDKGEAFTPSPDPLLESVKEKLEGIGLGTCDRKLIHEKLSEILNDETIFGVDVYKAGLGEITEEYFTSMLKGEGAVYNLLRNMF
ncbi:MAG: mannitol dehydrogenase family protein [Lachnospiraceae bacterium]|nr:mannitol dehydrogenase family protein [Lachnospiraceae bacterium]